MSTLSAMWLGALLAWSPSILFLAIVLYRDWIDQQNGDHHNGHGRGR